MQATKNSAVIPGEFLERLINRDEDWTRIHLIGAVFDAFVALYLKLIFV